MRGNSKVRFTAYLIILILSLPQAYALENGDMDSGKTHFNYANESWALISLGLGIILSFYLIKKTN
jgi:hypothetical protein